MFDLVINQVHIITGDNTFLGSVAMQDGLIAEILIEDVYPATCTKELIDGEGKYLFPGLIDGHVHLNDPGYTWREDFPHGTAAAAVGGVTTVIDMPMQNEPALSSSEIFYSKSQHLIGRSYIDYAFWGALVNYNFDQLPELNSCGAVAYKSFLSPVDDGYTSLQAGEIRHGLSILKEFNGLVGFHCEDYSIIHYEEALALKEGRLSRQDFLNTRPLVAEITAVQTIIALAKEQNARVHICHVSHPEVAQLIKDAKRDHVLITAETCPHYLIFNEEDLLEKGGLYKCAPPLRSKDASSRLWDYVLDGTLDLIVSDHSPAAPPEKSEENGFLQVWGGLSGLQTGLQILFDAAIHKRQLPCSLIARTMCENPAKVFSISHRKGFIKVGYDADFVLVDPEKEWEITTESLKYLNPISAFVGLKGKGLPTCTILRGEVIAKDGMLTHSSNYGQLITKSN